MTEEAHEHLFAAFDAVTRLIHQSAENESLHALQSFELTLSQARTMFVLACAPRALAISEIAAEINLSVAATGRVIDHLVKENLVERHESTTDRRIKLVGLTSRGRELANAHIEAKKDAVRRMLARLDAGQCDALVHALAPLTALVKETDLVQ